MYTGTWETRAEFDTWWRMYGRDHNLLAVVDPREWERVAKKIEAATAGFNKADLQARHSSRNLRNELGK